MNDHCKLLIYQLFQLILAGDGDSDEAQLLREEIYEYYVDMDNSELDELDTICKHLLEFINFLHR